MGIFFVTLIAVAFFAHWTMDNFGHVYA